MKRFNRADTIENLTKSPLELLIVGGGIVGAGIARDSAMRGLRVGLVDQYDFAWGTSSRSSRLLHGGLRYLAQGNVMLVRESSVEKRIVHNIAPNISDPLPFIFPTYKCPPWGTWALWKLRIGVKIYDLLCSGKNLGKSSSLNAKELLEYLPGINPKDLTGAVRYFDGLTNDARLVIDTLRSSAEEGGLLLNYFRLEKSIPENKLWKCVLKDQLTGKNYEVTTSSIVNATGPWSERLEYSTIKLRLTKGVHLVIDRNKLPTKDAVVMTEGERILFVIPWGERVILGTTDTDYDGVIEDVRTTSEDIKYILGIVNQSFPNANILESDVISTWAGLRPLIADPDGSPSSISRSHEINNPKPGWWDVAGGKLTTYRLMAKQTVDKIENYLKNKVSKCNTAERLLVEPGKDDKFTGLVPPQVSEEAVAHYCRNEWAIHLDDIMTRRSSWYYYFQNADKIAVKAAKWMGDIFGWDNDKIQEELERYQNSICIDEQ